MKNKYYKVCRIIESKNKYRHTIKHYYSSSIYIYKVRYMLKRWVYPTKEGNPFLFVFSSKKAAIKYSLKDEAVFECEIGENVNIMKTKDDDVVLTDKVKITNRIK